MTEKHNQVWMPTTCAVLTAGLMIAVIAFLIAYKLIRYHYHG